jgi:hypothetical protein
VTQDDRQFGASGLTIFQPSRHSSLAVRKLFKPAGELV